MSNVIPQRMAAKVEGDFVLFLIGLRINKPWKVWKWAGRAADAADAR